MKFRRGRVLWIGVGGAMLSVGILLFSCGPTSPGKSSPLLSEMVITNQISGWAPVGNPINFVESTIINVVDGGSTGYCGTCSLSTLKAGFQQIMSKSQSADLLKLLVIDYGTTANAAAEFDKKVQGSSWTTENSLSPYSASELFYTSNSDGINLRSHFNNFYVEFQFTAYDSGAQSVPDASAFINYLHSKIVQ